jgi:hypothetical protein
VIKFTDAIDKGVTERPPVVGMSYAAFEVHAARQGNLLGMAIAHRDGDRFVVDVVRQNISIADAAAVLKRYGIAEVTGAVGSKDDALAHAVAGAINLLQQRSP